MSAAAAPACFAQFLRGREDSRAVSALASELREQVGMKVHVCEHPHCSERAHGCAEDAERLRHLVDDISMLSATGSFRSCGRRFGELRIALEQEMARVESCVLGSGNIAAESAEAQELRAAHHHIRRALDGLGEGISRAEGEHVLHALKVLQASLAAHRELERRALRSFSSVVAEAADR